MDSSTPNRRTVLKQTGKALLFPSLLAGCSLPTAKGADPVKVGILYSQTGTMALSGMAVRNADILAIEEINAAGGLLGRQIEVIEEDPKSRTELFAKHAEKLLTKDKVAAVFGCWTSASRKSVLPIVEKNNCLLFYPLQYEGNESSRNIIYTGAVPNQQILPALDWLLSAVGGKKKRFFLLGSDYVFPRTANFIIAKYLRSRGVEVVGETYIPLGYRDFTTVIPKIRKAEPDIIISTVNGDSNIAFYNELAVAEITPEKIPVLATSLGEDGLRSILPAKVKGHLAAWSYFQSIDTPSNASFITQFKKEFGPDRVTDDPIVSAYTQVYLWKQAVEKAGSFEVDKVRDAFRSKIEFNAPGYPIAIDPKTQHAYRYCMIGRIRDDRQFDVVFKSPGPIEPDPYPQFAFPGWSCDWTKGGVTRGADVKISQ